MNRAPVATTEQVWAVATAELGFPQWVRYRVEREDGG
jgi:hypothetical protein